MRKIDMLLVGLWILLCLATVITGNYREYFIWSLGFLVGYFRARGHHDD